MTDGAVYNIKPIGTEECLTYGSDGKLSLKQCSENDEKQQWANKGGSNNFQLIQGIGAFASSKCLEASGKLRVSACNNDRKFKWNRDTSGRLKANGNNKCLQRNESKVAMNTCLQNVPNAQKWDVKQVVITVPTPPSASPGSPSPSSNSPGSPGSSPTGSTSPSSATTPTPSPSSDDKKFWETTWFFWSAIGGGAFIVLSIIVCVIIIAVSSGSGGGGGHHPW